MKFLAHVWPAVVVMTLLLIHDIALADGALPSASNANLKTPAVLRIQVDGAFRSLSLEERQLAAAKLATRLASRGARVEAILFVDLRDRTSVGRYSTQSGTYSE